MIFNLSYFTGATIISFLAALSLGHLSRAFPAIGAMVQIVALVVGVLSFAGICLKRDREATAAWFFLAFFLSIGGGMAWL